jgi:hypothetical protein
MNKKTNHIRVTKRVNWVLTCKDLMPVHYWTFKEDEGLYDTDKAYTYTYPIDGVISFKNHMHLMVKLTPAAHRFLIYLTQQMHPITNEFHNDASTKLYFIDFMEKKCMVTIKKNTVNSALRLLLKVGYVIKRSKAKRLIINPLYFFRGTMRERENLIRELLHEAAHPKIRNNDIKEKLGLKI